MKRLVFPLLLLGCCFASSQIDAQRPESSGTTGPGLVAPVNPDPAIRAELGIFDLERRDPVAISSDEVEVIELLEQKVAFPVVASLMGLARSLSQPDEAGSVYEERGILTF